MIRSPYRLGTEALLILTAALALYPAGLWGAPGRVGPVPSELRTQLNLDPWYQKYVAVGEFPIVSSEKTTDFALLEAAYVIGQMLEGRPEILKVLATNRVKLVVMAYNEFTTDLPEQRQMEPRVYWDSRARGLGGHTCSCAEENLL